MERLFLFVLFCCSKLDGKKPPPPSWLKIFPVASAHTTVERRPSAVWGSDSLVSLFLTAGDSLYPLMVTSIKNFACRVSSNNGSLPLSGYDGNLDGPNFPSRPTSDRRPPCHLTCFEFHPSLSLFPNAAGSASSPFTLIFPKRRRLLPFVQKRGLFPPFLPPRTKVVFCQPFHAFHRRAPWSAGSSLCVRG